MQYSRKGFTLIELLAVVVILGIIMTVSIPAVSRWINRSKVESKESQKKTLLMAGESYAQGNSKVLPKVIGEEKIIRAEDLKKANYLKDNLKDADKNDCMKDSFVRIYKYDQKGYTYTAYIYCEGDEVPANITGVPTDISISFSGENISGDHIEDVSISAFTAIIRGNKDDNTLGIDGYSYTVAVKYNGSGEFVEIYNSGSLNAGGRPLIKIEKRLSEYTDITTASEFLVTVEAYNRDGGYHKFSKSSKYGDTTPPVCGEITGQAGENEWDKSWRRKTISVLCSDEKNGSGCVKNEYKKSWNTEIEDDVITISDNAGNTTDCSVRVHLDWTTPTVTINAYKRNANGSAGERVGTVTADNAHQNVTLNSYTGGYGENSWLNYSNFPNGIIFEAVTSDNIILNRGVWYENAIGLWLPNNAIDTLTEKSSKTFTNSDNKATYPIVNDGFRKARFVFNDKALNTVTINITSPFDRTIPSISASKSHLDTEDGVTVTVNCGDDGSKCKENSYTRRGVKSRTTYSVIDNAGNENSTSVPVYSYDCHPYDCNPYKCNCHLYCAMYSGDGPDSPNASCQVQKTKCDTCYHTCYKTCYS